MQRATVLLLLALLTLTVRPAAADLVVVAGPKSGVERLTQKEVVYLFMGRWRQLPSGIPALPIDLAIDSPERAEFYRRLVNKEPAEIKAYWSRLVFSGGSLPPYTTEGREGLIRLVSNNPGAIGYLERNQVDSRLRIVFEFPATP
ncbi:MAG: hypothetical protein H6R15_1126 [Proteobacteria bacterium]|nr:hypothetical protein [Pseudomonadota bacterium]